MNPNLTLAGLAATGALAAGGLVLVLQAGSPAEPAPVDLSSAVRTTLPGLDDPGNDPGLRFPARATVAGVGRVAGPFDDRFRLTGLQLTPTGVAGRIEVTSDVSDLLELQVEAAFYDAAGRRLGQASYLRHTTQETLEAHDTGQDPAETVRWRVAAPDRYADRVASVLVGVPVLVNE